MYVSRFGPGLKAKPAKRRRAVKHDDKNHSPLIDPDALYEQLRALKPYGSTGSYDFKWEYLCNELLSKLPRAGVSAKDRQNAAVAKMLESEDSCRELNQNGYKFSGFGYTAEWFNTVLFNTQKVISCILPDVSYSIFENARFSGGASTSRSRRLGHPYFKYSKQHGPVHCTPKAYKYAKALQNLTPLWAQEGSAINVVPGNRITTVPKKTEIDRCIAMEPDVNMALQLCIGKEIRANLLRFGIDLRDQTRNQRMALRGSRTGRLATIDLSSASDSISHRLVRDLVPHAWFSLLEDLRSPVGTLPNGDLIAWEKFSSMGNGYTFELETLIFFAITVATVVTETDGVTVSSVLFGKDRHQLENITVYGDDIICETIHSHNVIRALSGFGFSTNHDKTFTTGPFRESCGKHYHDGNDVTPFYVRKGIDNTSRCIWFLNSLRNWASDDGICDPTLYPIWRQYTKNFIPRKLRGGKDVMSCAALCSPGKPNKRLVTATYTRKISGYAALLQHFQGKNVDASLHDHWWLHLHGVSDYDVTYVEIDLLQHIKRTVVGDELIIPRPSAYICRDNAELWQEIPLFPKEIV